MKPAPGYSIVIDGVEVRWTLRPHTESELRHTVYMGDLPYEYYESRDFKRVSGTEMAYKKATRTRRWYSVKKATTILAPTTM